MPENEKVKKPAEVHFFQANFSSESYGSPVKFSIYNLEKVESLNGGKIIDKLTNIQIRIDATNSDAKILGELRRTANQKIGLGLIEMAKDNEGNKTYELTIYPSLPQTFSRYIKPIPFIATAPRTNAMMTNTVDLINLREIK